MEYSTLKDNQRKQSLSIQTSLMYDSLERSCRLKSLSPKPSSRKVAACTYFKLEFGNIYLVAAITAIKSVKEIDGRPASSNSH